MTSPMVTERLPVVGTAISATSYREVLELLQTGRADRATVVAVCNVHSVMSARRDPALRSALAMADVATPDGMPLVWALRWLYGLDQQRVYGPELMRRALLEEGADLRHFLYGSSEATLERLRAAISSEAPKARIVGSLSPPFRTLTDAELADHARVIRQSGAGVVWVGLGMPKQELWMHRIADRMPGVALVGVGAAFDFLAGTIRQAPQWTQRAGLEWLFRLTQEPRRLWRRYVWNNPAFLGLLATQLARAKLCSSARLPPHLIDRT